MYICNIGLRYIRLGLSRQLMIKSYSPVAFEEANHKCYPFREMNSADMLREHIIRSFPS